MNAENLRSALLGFPHVTEETPFDEHTVVYKIAGKMYALTDYRESPLSVNLKCDPELAGRLREQHPCVHPGYHMSKKHWNTVVLDGSVAEPLIRAWILHSLECVIAGLPKAKRKELEPLLANPPSTPPIQDPELRDRLRKTI